MEGGMCAFKCVYVCVCRCVHGWVYVSGVVRMQGADGERHIISNSMSFYLINFNMKL